MSRTLNKLKNKIKKSSFATRMWRNLRDNRQAARAARICANADAYAKKHNINPRKIVFMTRTFSYTCNPKYIYEEILRQNMNVECVWLSDGEAASNDTYPEGARVVNYASEEGAREVATSAVWIDNGVCFARFFNKRPGQIHVQTMHGSLGIKRLKNSIPAKLAVKGGDVTVRRESCETDFVITDSAFEESIFRGTFWKNTPMVRLGHARTDILINAGEEEKTKIRRKLREDFGVPEESKVVLYAPTYRQGLSVSEINIHFRETARAFSERFGGDFCVLVKLHPFTKDFVWPKSELKYMYDVTDYPDIQDLMVVADAAITDYSSWIFDYVLTKRPGFIYAADADKYNNLSYLSYKLEESPFPVSHNPGELLEDIRKFDLKAHEEAVCRFLDEKQAVDDGGAAERIVEWLGKIMEKSHTSAT